MAKKSVLITGAAGFLGSHLAERFLSEGWQVLGVDNFLTGRESNLATFRNHPDFRFEKANVVERFDFKNPFGGKFDWIYHFACPASPVDFDGLAQEILEVDSIGLRSMYDEAKRFSEAATMVYHRKYNLDTRIVRIFNTYGPRMRLNDGRVVPALCEQALKGEPLTVHGNGLQTRSFCFVSDLIDGIYRLGQSKEILPTNVGNPLEFTMLEFAEVVQKVSGKKLSIEHLPARPDDPRRRCPDISKAKRILGWEPKVQLEEGLRQTLESFRGEI